MTLYGNPLGDSGARSQAAAASSDAAAAKREVTTMADEIARLRLVCAALWDLVKDKTGLTEEDLIARIAILDARDGVADGKLTRTARKCFHCGRSVAARQNKCMFCGKTQPVENVFEGI